MMELTHTSTDNAAIPPIVLLVENDRATLDRDSVFFESSGLWVATAGTPGAAMEAIAELQPDLVVTDLDFDGEPIGLQLVKAVKHSPVSTPVILLKSGANDAAALANAGADLCLVKPVPAFDLLAKVRMLLDRSQELRAKHARSMQKAAALVERSDALIARSHEIDKRVNITDRPCPGCGRTLKWVETGSIDRTEYDYYQWCDNRCGLYCFDRDVRRWIKLAG